MVILKRRLSFEVDMYTATGWVSAGTGILCLILYMPGIFRNEFTLSFLSSSLFPLSSKVMRDPSPTQTRDNESVTRDITSMGWGPPGITSQLPID